MNWVNAKERLPEQDEYVMIYIDRPACKISMGWYSTFQNKWFETNCGIRYGITHWMPLPNSPEQE